MSDIDTQISATDSHPRKKLKLIGTWISYVDTGAGDPVVFLHGNPTSSYLWRNIIPYLAPHARCVAPDSSGWARRDRRRLALIASRITPAISTHSSRASISSARSRWWCTTGAARSAFTGPRGTRCGQGNRIHGSDRQAAAMVGMVAAGGPIFKALRSPAGDDMILKNNIFVERICPAASCASSATMK